MAAYEVDSFDMPAIGQQCNSRKETMPAYSFGTGSREAARLKVYMSKKTAKNKCVMISPGPVYAQASTFGQAVKYSFGTDEQRKQLGKAKYPDSSVDLTCSAVDSQSIKFKSTPGVHFGTEARMSQKNGELLRGQPLAGYGMESPGALEYYPEKAEDKVLKKGATYSFGTGLVDEKDSKKDPTLKVERMKPLNMLSTPRHVGPGSHKLPHGVGVQPLSARKSAPSWSFGSSPRDHQHQDAPQLLATSADLSSLGKQVVSQQKTMPRHTFGTSTRESAARTQVVMNAGDVGPVAHMPKACHSVNLPKPGRLPPKAGM